MQTITPTLAQRVNGSMRRVSWQLKMAFDKTIDPTIVFFQLDTSELDSSAILAPGDSDVVQDWDKYVYRDYSDRVVSLEWSRQQTLPSAVSMAMADIVLDNHDGFFSTGSGSMVDGFVLPKRPLRLSAGFGGEVVPQFVGLTDGMPTLDKAAGTASFHCIDFLDSIFNRPLNQTVVMQNVTTDQVLDQLFQDVGLLPDQYELDVGYNSIPIVFFTNTTLLGDAVKQLMDAEFGRLFMDEIGIIRFKNRTSFSTTSVATFDTSNTVDKEASDLTNLINVVTVTANPREVQDKQLVWQQADVRPLDGGGGSIALWADLPDPATTMDEPVVGAVPNTSYITVRDGPDTTDTEVTSNISISDPFLFGLSYQVTITNSNAFPVYVMGSELWGTPALVVDQISTREQDDVSVDEFDEVPYQISTDFIQSEDAARSLSLSILHEFAAYGAVQNIGVKANPALQLSDPVALSLAPTTGVYNITGITSTIASPAFEQQLQVTQITTFDFFALDRSILDGPDVLAV